MRQSYEYHSLGDEADNAIQEGEDSDIGSRWNGQKEMNK